MRQIDTRLPSVEWAKINDQDKSSAPTSRSNQLHSAHWAEFSALDGHHYLPSESETDNPLDYPRADKISAHAAQQALNRLFSHHEETVSLNDLNPMRINILVMMLIAKFTKDSNAVLSKVITRSSDLQVFLRDQQVEDFQKQIAKAVEQGEKAKKAGVCAAVFDWIIGAAEVVWGVCKMVEGMAELAGTVLTGGLSAVAGIAAITAGLAYIGAGCAGISKGTAEMCLALGYGDKEQLKKFIEKEGEIQLGLEITAMLFDLIKGGALIGVALNMIKPALEETLKAGTSEMLGNLAREAGDTITTEEVKQIINTTARFVAQETAELVIVDVTKSFTQEAFKEALASATKKTMEEVIKGTAKKAVKEAAEEIAGQIEKKILQKVMTKVSGKIMKNIVFTWLTYLRFFSGSIVTIHNGLLKSESADITEKIQKLILNQEFDQNKLDIAERSKQQDQKMLKKIVESYADLTERTFSNNNQYALLQTKIANSIA